MPNPEAKTQANRIAAKRAAEAEGLVWAKIPVKDRLKRLQSAGAQVGQTERRQAVVKLARQKAKKAGLNWREIPKEERRSIIKGLRSKK